jgi:filamentous hemagglutinin
MIGLPGIRVVEIAKVEAYLLNQDHPTGRAKAAFFARFGYDSTDPVAFAVALDRHGATRPILRTSANAYGIKYEVRCGLETPDGRNPCIVTVWLQRERESACRLITAYPADR